MPDNITTLLVQIKGDATGVMAAFKDLALGASNANTQIAVTEKALNRAGREVVSFREQVRAVKEPLDGMYLGLALMGDKIPGVDEALMAMQATVMGTHAIMRTFELTLEDVLLPAAAIVSVIAGGFFVWEELGNHLGTDAEQAKKLADELEKIPGIVDKLYGAEKLGAITEAQRKQYENYLSGATPLYQMPGSQDKNDPSLTENSRFYLGQNARPGSRYYNSKAFDYLEPATQEQRRVYAENFYNKSMADNAGTVAKNEVSQTDAQQQTKLNKPGLEATRQQNELLNQGLAIYKKQQEIIYGTAAKIGEMSAKEYEADERKREQLEKEAQLKRDIARTDIEAAMQAIQDNQLMSNQQKLQITSALNDKLTQINQAEIKDLENLKSQAASLTDQLELEKKIADLKQQNQKLADQTTPKQQNSFSFQFGKTITDQQNKWSGWAQESAKSFQNAWDGSTNAVSGGLTRLFEYGAQKGQWFREIWNGVIGSMISSVTKLAVDWIAQHVIMAGAEKILTAAAAEGSVERGAIRLAETIFHNMLVALRVAVHIAGEAAATAATYAYAIVRALYHAVVAAVAAMESEASVPYVGVILGIAAAAAILAAAYGLMGGFAEGGYTGDGHPSKVAGVVHAGEYVIPANRVNSSTMPLLAAIHTGNYVRVTAPRSPDSSSSSSSGGSTVQHNTSHYIYTDKAKMARQIEQDDAHEQWVIDTVAKSSHKLK